MEKLLELAATLGTEIRNHERYARLREAEQKVLDDPQAKEIQNQLSGQTRKVVELERSMRPIEVSDKRELARLQDAARSNPLIQGLIRAQADYFEMMNRINDAILEALRPEGEEEQDEEEQGPKIQVP
jgi:cell fate (sporulation/competence/biofilm development) regulator YlbF (YheA/YmcA/DUF963 family)